MAGEAGRENFVNKDVYTLLIHPEKHLPRIKTDPKIFARKMQQELIDITNALSSDDNMVEIDGKMVDKSTSSGQLVINDKLSEIENLNNQNFNLIQVIRRTEDSLRQML